jgi:6,7-dimethyl-8-ribityllumazine synthase
MAQTIEGRFKGEGRSFAIVAGRFNELISSKLVEGALDAFGRHGVGDDDITTVWVPGAFEIPLTARKLASSGKFSAVVCVGAVVRGGTPHFDLIAAEVAKGVAQASLESGIPVIFGVITSDTIEQAVERAGTKMGNKGFDAGMAALEMADLFDQI